MSLQAFDWVLLATDVELFSAEMQIHLKSI